MGIDGHYIEESIEEKLFLLLISHRVEIVWIYLQRD